MGKTGADLETRALSYQFGDFTLDLARGCVLKGIQEIKLRPKVYEALKYLVEHPGRLVGKQELMQAVWPDAFVTDDSLVQCTLELRRALDDRDQKLLKTVPRRGYVFAAEVIQHSKKTEFSPPARVYDLSDDRALSAAKIAKKLHGLPIPRTSLIGREQQVAEASELLLRKNVRLLSLTGPGGAGKTRLALAVASTIGDRFTAGVQFVSLASIKRSDLVATAIADALEIQQVPNRTVSQLMGTQLQNSGPFLLLLDNFEQVLPAAKLVADILEACPSLKILITSRSCLRIYGEQEFPVARLAENFALELFRLPHAAQTAPARISPFGPILLLIPTTYLSFRKFVRDSTDCRWQSSSRLPEPNCCLPAVSSNVYIAACICLLVVRSTCPKGNKLSATRLIGATAF